MSYSSLSLGIFIFIMAFFLTSQSFQDLTVSVFTPQLAPSPSAGNIDENSQIDATAFCQTVAADNAPTFKAPADNADKIGSKNNSSLGTPIFNPDCKSDGPNHQFSRNPTTYRLIRKNVPITKNDVNHSSENFTGHSCHFDSAESLNIDIPEIDKNKYKIFYPQISGEIDMKRTLPSRTRGGEGEKTLMYFIDYGLIFALHLNSDGGFTELAGGTIEGKAETFVLADIYQDIESPGRDNLPDEALACDTTKGAKIASGPQVVVPGGQQTNTDSSQLQLEYFVFGTAQSSGPVTNGWGIHCKPAIYLYPNQKQLVNVKVQTKGFLTYVDPPYDNQKGWTVEANPNGDLYPAISYQPSPPEEGRVAISKYPYLYYESKLPRALVQKPNTGWVIKQEDLSQFFLTTVPKLGLNPKETQAFTDYWSKTLTTHPYYFIGVLDQNLINSLEPLEITPQPDSINRVRLYFEGLSDFQQIPPPDLSSIENLKLKIKNSRLSVSEWGGVVDTGKDPLFVCNQ